MRLKSQAWHLVIALILVAGHVFAAPSAAAAFSIDRYEYFDIDYYVTLSGSEVQDDEVFSLLFEGYVKCVKDLPFGIDRADVIISIIAEHRETGAMEILNIAYSVTITPFPDWEGESYEFEESMNLVFPGRSQPGEYNVIGQLVQAKVDGWDITGLIAERYKSFSLGTITYITSARETMPPTTPSFAISNMSINPGQVEVGQTVTISVELSNVGGTEGSYTLNLMINGELQDSQEIILAPQESKPVIYTVSKSEEGNYEVSLDGQSGVFTVVSVSPSASALLSWLSRHWLLIALVIFFLTFIL